jgi:UDP-N-acetyl-D-glucosamine dehydrogenase
MGARVDYNDPYVPSFSGLRRYPALSMRSIGLSEKKLRQYDCSVIITDHSRYDFSWILRNSRLVIDTRNALRDIKSSKIVKA